MKQEKRYIQEIVKLKNDFDYLVSIGNDGLQDIIKNVTKKELKRYKKNVEKQLYSVNKILRRK